MSYLLTQWTSQPSLHNQQRLADPSTQKSGTFPPKWLFPLFLQNIPVSTNVVAEYKSMANAWHFGCSNGGFEMSRMTEIEEIMCIQQPGF